jgi:integrase
MPHTRNRYQEGSLVKVARATGPFVWVFRWRERQPDGSLIQKKRVIGTVERLKTLKEAKREVENFRAEINAAMAKIGRMNVTEAWGHFQLHELHDPDVDRSPTTIENYLDYFQNHIIPKWGETLLEDVKSVAVEKWLRSITALAPGSKTKIRNHMSALFAHCIRHELYDKLNPIASVRQSAKRQKEPDILSVAELVAVLSNIESPAIFTMVLVAGATALRRSEILGLRWQDVDFENLMFHPKRGVVRKHHTKMKSNASRKPVAILSELAQALLTWQRQTLYPMPTDWVFASPFTNGKRPLWPDTALKNHIRPAVKAAGIKGKTVGWHTFRHSLGSLLGTEGENIKVVQEILRHANSRITIDVYQQADSKSKRAALSHMSGIFVVNPPKAS